jgi:hypothetical protein
MPAFSFAAAGPPQRPKVSEWQLEVVSLVVPTIYVLLIYSPPYYTPRSRFPPAASRGAYNKCLHFRLYPLRFCFLAREAIRFPPGMSSNLLRGAFGAILRRIACVPDCPGATRCELRESCAYARMFEPSALGPGPSGLSNWPRPFVFRATHLDGSTIPPGAAFSFDMNLFDMRRPAIAYLVTAFSELAREGLGPGRGRAGLAEVWQRNEEGEAVTRLYDGAAFLETQSAAPISLDLDPAGEPVKRVRVRFVTPTELKSGEQLAEHPEFGLLAARIRDRLSTLGELYDNGPLAIDFRAFGERAARVRMTRCEISRVELTRRSSRTGQVHPLGGFTGEADYEGELAEFVPYLKAARWTGVGRQTVWGKGQIEVWPE